MTTRVVLRSPFGYTVVRSIDQGVWREDVADPDITLGEDMWALPGLVDGHSHLAGDGMPSRASPTDLGETARRGSEALEAGVTLLYDKGWSDETVLDLIEEVDPTLRPHIEAAGTMVATKGGYYPGFANEVEPSEIDTKVEEAIGSRASWVKLIGDWPRPGLGPQANFSRPELEAAVGTAERLGARVAIHTMAPEVPSVAVAAGVHSIEHGLFLEESDIPVLADRGGIWVPTLLQVEATAASLREGSSGQTLLLQGIANACRLLPLALEAGVIVLAGSDLGVTSAQVAAELIRLSECGVDSESLLRSAVGGGHRAAGARDGFSLGEPADAVLFPENPVNSIGVLTNPGNVIRQGRIVR